MPAVSEQLLCELHCHTTFSDGALTLREVVDLYGASNFDVLCITDHSVRSDDPWLHLSPRRDHVHAGNFESYLEAIEAEALRARLLYDLLVLPGLELTNHHADARHAAHAVAVGLHQFVEVDHGIEVACWRLLPPVPSSSPPIHIRFQPLEAASGEQHASRSNGNPWASLSTASS
jgi:hypothetical protein